MKVWCTVFFSLILHNLYCQEIMCTTFNIRYATENDQADAWNNRKADLAQYLNLQGSDFIGIQEALWEQVEYLDAALENYDFIGVGRDDGIQGGEAMVIFYDKSKWSLVNHDTKWLSNTPNIPSKGWDAACHRTLTIGEFKNSNGEKITVFNTHLDHVGDVARANSIELIKKEIKQCEHNYVLTGDFNFNPSTSLYQSITNFTQDSYRLARTKSGQFEGTFTGFDTENIPTNRIDYIFVNESDFEVLSYLNSDAKTAKGRYLSDHFPITVKLKVRERANSEYKYEQFHHNGLELNYRVLYPPNMDSTKKYPVVLFLHGMGERGTDNESQLVHGSKLFQDSIEKYPSIIIFPQCPPTDYWANLSRPDEGGRNRNFRFHIEEPPNPTMGLVIELLDSLLQEPIVDAERFYVSGLSMGAFGAWELMWRMPEKIAAAAPICGGGPISMAHKMTTIPIWVFHGVDDSVVHPRYSISMVKSVQRSGGTARISLYPGVDHNAWDYAFKEQDFLSWLFSKRNSN